MEPLAAMSRIADSIRGITVWVIKEKILLYADNTLLYLTDVTSSLPAALQILDLFGSYSGIKIHFGKFLLFLLHPAHPRPPSGTPLSWVAELKYLGIKVGGKLTLYYDLKMAPLLHQFSQQCMSWFSLPVGRVNLVTHGVLAEISIYFFFCNYPIPLLLLYSINIIGRHC